MMVMYNNNDNNYNYIDIIAGNICKFAGRLNEKSTHLNIKWQAFATDTIILNFQLYSIKHFLVVSTKTEQMHSQFSVQ